MIEAIKRLFRRNKSSFPEVKHEIKKAFTCGGIDYFQFEDFNNTPAIRGMKTMVFYTEMQMKCSLDFLRFHANAVNTILKSNNIDIYEIKKLNDNLLQRLDLAIDTELIYKIASVVFFTKDENVADYDYKFNRKKIEHWKKHGGADFFLQMPLQELMPFLKDTSNDFRRYSAMVARLNRVHTNDLLRNLPIEWTEKLNGSSSLSQVMTHPN